MTGFDHPGRTVRENEDQALERAATALAIVPIAKPAVQPRGCRRVRRGTRRRGRRTRRLRRPARRTLPGGSGRRDVPGETPDERDDAYVEPAGLRAQGLEDGLREIERSPAKESTPVSSAAAGRHPRLGPEEIPTHSPTQYAQCSVTQALTLSPFCMLVTRTSAPHRVDGESPSGDVSVHCSGTL